MQARHCERPTTSQVADTSTSQRESARIVEAKTWAMGSLMKTAVATTRAWLTRDVEKQPRLRAMQAMCAHSSLLMLCLG